MSELKLKKLQEYNSRLREQLDMQRVPVSEASQGLIKFVKSTKDCLVPSVWGAVPKGEDPYGKNHGDGCCGA